MGLREVSIVEARQTKQVWRARQVKRARWARRARWATPGETMVGQITAGQVMKEAAMAMKLVIEAEGLAVERERSEGVD